jgi:hypothetical protein
MKKIFILFSVCGFLSSVVSGAPFDSFYGFSARSLGLGCADVALADDWSAINVNPAGLVQLSAGQFGASYSDFYQTENLFNASVAFVEPFDFNAVGIFWNELALTPVYREDTVRLSWARQLTNKLAIGLNGVLYYQALSRQDMTGLLSGASALSFDTGLLWQSSQLISIGLMAENVPAARIGLLPGVPPEQLPSVGHLGINMQPLPETHILLEANSHGEFGCGGEIGFSDLLFLRLGWRKNYPTLGLGLKINRGQFDFGMLNNSDIGNVYRLTFTWQI